MKETSLPSKDLIWIEDSIRRTVRQAGIPYFRRYYKTVGIFP